jgi:hypothetical protein
LAPLLELGAGFHSEYTGRENIYLYGAVLGYSKEFLDEKLSGDKKGLESVRVNDKYRIEFISSIEGEEPDTITICEIVELSNHYS